MNDFLRAKLCELLTAHGRPLLEDRARCEALLWLAAGENSRGLAALTGALERKVPQALLTAPPERRDAALLAKLTRRLVDDLALDESAARWAVESWALAVAAAPAQPLVPLEARPQEPTLPPPRHPLRPAPAVPPEFAGLPPLALDDEPALVLPAPRDVGSSISLDRFFTDREPEGTFLQGSTEGVSCLAYSADGDTLATGHDDGTVRFWDAHTGQPRGALPAHFGRVNALAFAPGGPRIASAGADGDVKLWDAAERRELTTLDGHDGPALCVAFAPDGNALASGGADGSVRLWDAAEGLYRRSLQGHSGPVTCLAYCPDGRTLASGSLDGTVRLWDLGFGSYWGTLTGHASGVTALAYAPDGELLLTAGQDWRVRLWDAVSAREVTAFAGRGAGHTQPVHCAAFAPNGWTAVSAGGDEAVRVWDVAARRELCTFAGPSGAVHGVAYSPDGRWLAAAGADGAVRRWRAPEAERPAPVRRLGRPKARATSALKAALLCLGAVGLLAGGLFLFARLRGTSTPPPGRGGNKFPGPHAALVLEGHTDGVAALALSADGRTVLSGSFDKSVRLWNLDTGQELRRFDGHTAPVLAVALSADGRRALSGGLDKTVRLWDVQTGQQLRGLDGFAAGVTCVAFAPDGKRFATGGVFEKVTHTLKNEPGQPPLPNMEWRRPRWGDLALWETDTGRKIYALAWQGVGHGDAVTSLAFTPDGDRLVSGSFDKTVSLWDLKTGKEIRRFRGHTGEVFGVAVSPDGKRLLSCSGSLGPVADKKKEDKAPEPPPQPPPPEPPKKAEPDCTVRLWELDTGKELRTFHGHENAVFAVAFSPDGQRALSGSFDATLRLWDVESGQELDRYLEHKAAVTCVAFTPDGRAVSGGWDKKLRVWRLP